MTEAIARPQRRLVEHQVLAVRRRRRRARPDVPRPDRGHLAPRPRFIAKDARGRPSRPRRPGPRARRLGHEGALDHLIDCPARGARRPPPGRRRPSRRAWRRSSTRSRCASTRRCSPSWSSSSRWRRCTSRTTSRRSARCWSARPTCRRSPASTRRSTAPSPTIAQRFALPARTARGGRPALRLPRAVLRVHRSRAAAASTRRAAAGRTSSPTSATAPACAPAQAARSVATTMGFTAVDGLPMGTRCGALDPGVILYLMDERGHGRARDRKAALHASRACSACPASPATCATLLASERSAREAGRRPVLYRIGRELGSLAAALGGLDALVFTAGIGENAPPIRSVSAATPHGWASSSTTRRTPQADRASAPRAAGSPRGSSRPTKN